MSQFPYSLPNTFPKYVALPASLTHRGNGSEFASQISTRDTGLVLRPRLLKSGLDDVFGGFAEPHPTGSGGAWNPVSVGPQLTEMMFTPVPWSSNQTASVRSRTNFLLAEYVEEYGIPPWKSALQKETLMTVPSLRCTNIGK